MKTFVLSLVLLTAVLAAVATATVYNITTVSVMRDSVADVCQTLSEENLKNNADAIQDFYENWNKKSPCLSVSVSKTDLSKVEDALDEARGAAHAEDYPGFAMACYRLQNAIDNLYDRVRPHLHGII